MGVILTLSDKKELCARTYALNYKTENNFETLTIYLPLTYNGRDLTEYSILLNILNVDNQGDIITLSEPETLQDRYRYKLPIKAEWTYKPGKLIFWIKFISDSGEIGITNETSVMVNDSKEISEYVPSQSLSLLDEWEIKMKQTNKTTQNMLDKANEMYSNPPYIGENLTWYIYDINTNTYIDSGIKVSPDIETKTVENYWIMFGKEMTEEGGD